MTTNDVTVPRRLIALGAIALAAIVLTGCGGSSSSTTTKTTTATTSPATNATSEPASTAPAMTQQGAGQAYLAAVEPANAALHAFQKKASSWTDSTTGEQAAADAKPLIDALTALRPKLLEIAQKYPPAANDLKALVTAFSALQGDLENLTTVNTFNASSWVQGFTKDAAALNAAVAIVRSDLGLPPVSTS